MPRKYYPPPAKVIDIPIPLGGLDTHVPYSRQTRQTALGAMQTAEPGLFVTTPTAINVRGFDAQNGRRRLSRRMGLSKLVGQQILGAQAVQELVALSGTQYITGTGFVIPGSGVSQFSGTVVVGIANDPVASWYLYVGAQKVATGGGGTNQTEVFAGACTDGAFFYITTVFKNSHGVSLYKIDAKGVLQWSRIAFTLVVQDTDARYRQKPGLFNQGTPGYGVGPPVIGLVSTAGGGTLFVEGKGSVTTTTSTPSASTVYVSVEGQGVFRFFSATGLDVAANPFITRASIIAQHGGYEPTGGLAILPAGAGILQTLAVGLSKIVAGQTPDAGLFLVNIATAAHNPPTGALSLQAPGSVNAASAYPYLFSDGSFFYAAVQNYQNLNVSAVHQINVGATVNWTVKAGDALGFGYYSGSQRIFCSGNTTNLALKQADGTNAGSGPDTGLLEFFDLGSGYIFLENAIAAFLYNGSTNVWSAQGLQTTGRLAGLPVGSGSTGGALADSGQPANLMNYNRAVVLLGVAGGTVRVGYAGAWSTPQGGGSALNGVVKVVRSAVQGGNVYFADGTNWKLYSPTQNLVFTWAPTAGALPVDVAGNKPRLIATWRNRIMLSGLPLDGANYFGSGVGDPTNFDYNPAPSVETQAFAGNLTPAGLCPDIITALVPYNDDVLIFGCDSHIYQMTGDPAAGGRIDLVSDVTGMAWGNAWCKSPSGVLYFVGSRGQVYEMAPGAVPQRISYAIDQQFASINMGANLIRLVYHERFDGFHVFVTPIAGGTATHYYYDVQAKAWWSDQFGSTTLDPFAVLAFDGDLPGQRYVALAGQDGWVRVFSPAANDDDGVTITSSVLCGPVQQGAGLALRLDDLWAVLAGSEGSVNWGLKVGDWTEQAFNATARYTGTFLPGRSQAQPVRAAGVAHFVSLSRSASEPAWSLEALRCFMTPLSQQRQRMFG